MPRKEVITCEALPPGRALLSHATRFGNLLFVQGCTGRHPTTGEVGKDIREQARYTLDRIKMILEAAGSSLDNVLTNTCYVTRAEDLEGFNEVTLSTSKKTGRPALLSSSTSEPPITWWR